MTRNIVRTCLLASAVLISVPAHADSLENLERERSIMVAHVLDADLNVAQRQEKMAFSKRRLADLERIALNDKALKDSRSPLVLKVFRNYDMSFVVHSAAAGLLQLGSAERTQEVCPDAVEWLAGLER